MFQLSKIFIVTMGNRRNFSESIGSAVGMKVCQKGVEPNLNEPISLRTLNLSKYFFVK